MSNLPTVGSNALVGVALALSSTPAGFPWGQWMIVATACSMLYVAGMIHNDVADAAVDAGERPGRPIPSGRIDGQFAAIVAGLILIAGVLLLWLTPEAHVPVLLACGLAVLIVAYNLLHRRGAWTVLLTASCRAMVYVIGAAAVVWPLEWRRVGPFAVGIGVYVVVISLIARSETGASNRVRIVVAMICAISLLDAAFLLVLRQPIAAGAAVACFGLAALMQRRILGT